jgi:hypothetical protein
LNGQQQQKIAEEKQKDELLKTYINDMKASLLDKDYPLKDSKKNSESRSIARTITLTTLTQLNSEQDQQKAKERKYNQRKGLIIQFLYESGLIKIDPKVASIISLNTADLTFAELYRANLESARLYRANLISANLNFANLNRANLESANLNRANLFVTLTFPIIFLFKRSPNFPLSQSPILSLSIIIKSSLLATAKSLKPLFCRRFQT